MGYNATVLQVMVASPSEVNEERQLVQQVLGEWNAVHAKERKIVLLPAMWETHSAPSMGDRPQEIINKQVLRDCDILIAFLLTRLGTSTGKFPSGTVEEIEEHLRAGKPAMLYFSEARVAPDKLDMMQFEALRAFREEVKMKGLIETYSDLPDLRGRLSLQLSNTLNKDSYIKTLTNKPQPLGSENTRGAAEKPVRADVC